jgi:hypothetical protein
VQAAAIEKDRADLIAATADNTWTLTGTDTFASKARKDAGPVLPPAPPQDTAAFVKDQKARATAPPSPRQ